MKTIATLALSALAVNAFDSQAYINAFSQQFGLDQTAVNDANDCITGIQSTVMDLIQLVQQNQNNVEGLALQAESIGENIQATLTSDCQPIAQDFAVAVSQKLEGQDIRQVVSQNFQQYFPQIVQKIAQWVQYIGQGDETKAGQTEAYIFQVLLGIEQPETLPVPEFTTYVPIDEDKFLSEYFTAVFNTLGMTDVDVSAMSTCVKNIQSFTGSLQTLINQFSTLDFAGRIEAVKDFVVEVAPEVEGCEGMIDIQEEIFQRALTAAGDNKLGFILETVGNLALNLPEYINLKQKVEIEVYEGEYILAGEDEAKSVQLIDGGRIFNN